MDRQIGRQGHRQQSYSTNTVEVNAITETSSYFVAFHHHHHHLSWSLALSLPLSWLDFSLMTKAFMSLLCSPLSSSSSYSLSLLLRPSLTVSPLFSLLFMLPLFYFAVFFTLSCTFFCLSFSFCIFSLCLSLPCSSSQISAIFSSSHFLFITPPLPPPLHPLSLLHHFLSNTTLPSLLLSILPFSFP